MKNSEILGMVISAKLDMAARLTGRLPGDMGKKLEEAGETVLTVLNERITLFLQQQKDQKAKDSGLKKVELD